MSTSRGIDYICIAVIILTLVITGLFAYGESLGMTVIHSKESDNTVELFTENDKNGAWEPEGATTVLMEGDSVTVHGKGAYYDGTTIHIEYAGRYVLQGNLSCGNIKVDAEGDDKIWLMLDNAKICSPEECALFVKKADKVFVTMAEGTQNLLEGSETGKEGKRDGVIYSKADLTLNGSGLLTIAGAYKHGIVCKDSLTVYGCELTVEATEDAIQAKDFRTGESVLTLSAGDDAIHVENDDGTAPLVMDSGRIFIQECYEGMEANRILINGGDIEICMEDDGINAYGDVTADITINGGNIRITSEICVDGDGLDSNGTIHVNGGEIFISIPNVKMNTGIDYGTGEDVKSIITGGRVIACAARNDGGFLEESPQGFLMKKLSGEAGAKVSVENEAGETLISGEIPNAFSLIIVSCPEMKKGDEVRLIIDGSETLYTVDNKKPERGKGGPPGGKGGERPNMSKSGEKEFSDNRPEGPDGPPPEGGGPGKEEEETVDFETMAPLLAAAGISAISLIIGLVIAAVVKKKK